MRDDEGEAEEDRTGSRREAILQQRVDEQREKVGVEVAVETLQHVHGGKPKEVPLTQQLAQEVEEGGRGGR